MRGFSVVGLRITSPQPFKPQYYVMLTLEGVDPAATNSGQFNSTLPPDTALAKLGGCIFSYNGSSSIYTSGSTVLPALTSGQASRTIPCAWSYSSPQISSKPPTATSTRSKSSTPSPTFPATFKYKDPNLTGCYAGTGGSTTFTLTSGEALTFFEPYSRISIGPEPRTFNLSCVELFSPGVRLPWRLIKSFAKSPACGSYAREIHDIRSAQRTASSWIPTPILPIGVENGDAHIPFECCGGCELYVPEIQVLYWSTQSQIACSQSNATMTSDATLTFPSSEAQMPADSGLASYTVLDGSTLTFPSTYLVIRGAISVTDRCGTIGKTYTNPTIAVPQGGLSTLSFSSTYIAFAGFLPQTGPFDPAVCRTYGISNGSTSSWLYDDDGDGTSSWFSTVTYTFGPPYNPILLPPPQLTGLDPEWQACTSWRTFGADAYAGYLGLVYDPPRALTRAPSMVDPSTTKIDPAPQPTQSSPQPAGSISPAAPRLTDKPTNVANPGLSMDLSPSSVKPDNKATLTADPKTRSPEIVIPGGGSAAAADLSPPEDHSDPMTSDTGLAGFILHPFQPIANKNGGTQGGGDPATKPHIISSESSEPDPPILTIDDSAYTANKASEYIVGSETLSAGGPAIRVSGVLYSLASSTATLPNIASILSAMWSNNEPILTIDGKSYTADSASQYIVGSQTLAPGGPTITVNNIPYALPASSAVIVSGGSTIALDQKAAADATLLSMLSAVGFDTNHQPQTYTLDGIKMVGGPSTLAVGSATLAPGSPALTISGHTLSLASEGTLIVDGRTSILNTPSLENNKQYQIYTVNGIPLTGNAAALVVGSATLAPDSPALTISRHTLSLGIGGALVVDGRTSILNTPSFGSNTPYQTYIIDSIPLTGNPTALMVGSTTLTAGSPALTISGHVVSLATGGTLVVDGRTSILSSDTSSSSLNNGSEVASATGASISGTSRFEIYTGRANHAPKARKMLQILSLSVCLTSFILLTGH